MFISLIFTSNRLQLVLTLVQPPNQVRFSTRSLQSITHKLAHSCGSHGSHYCCTLTSDTHTAVLYGSISCATRPYPCISVLDVRVPAAHLPGDHTHTNTAILVLRIYAMYHCNRILLWILLGLFMAELVTETAIIAPSALKSAGTQQRSTSRLHDTYLRPSFECIPPFPCSLGAYPTTAWTTSGRIGYP